MLPKTTIHTRTTAPDGKVVYEDDREVQERTSPCLKAYCITETLAPILAARHVPWRWQEFMSSTRRRIVTEAIADLDIIESQLTRAAKALGENKEDVAATALSAGHGPGRRFPFQQGGLSIGRCPRRTLAGAAVAGREQRRPGDRQPRAANSGCGSIAKWPHKTSARTWTRCSVRCRSSRTSSVARQTSPPARAKRTHQRNIIASVVGQGQ